MREIMTGLVSVVIPVFNRAGLLREAVASALAQTYRPIEILVCDDGSTDDTPAVVDRLARENPGLVRALHGANGGAGAARERGRLAARGEYIQYLDSDDRLLPEKFAVQVAALRAHATCDIAYGITRLIDESGAVLREPYKWSGRRLDHLFPGLLVDRWWNTHTPLWRRSVCDAVGPWSRMRVCEDWEYEARAGGLRVRLWHCPVTVSEHRNHGGARLTGGKLQPSDLRDTTRLLRSLFRNAMRAGVPRDAVEMQHVGRWAFLTSRRAASAGLQAEARTCLAISLRVTRGMGPAARGLATYRRLVGAFGWRTAGWMATAACVARGGPGKLTLPSAGESPPG